ncbi:hypothetical protein PsYK624_095690 [Phanerochaete sordida]|uniref:Uncharacterized protein n=1 Tax=Phanerochaete sordida TaxID=48140 RepID=A0A9P3GEM1_9APHY|nr:hypothetical protein PsYK624_095690 [Phanerochaete sordida]
MASTSSLTDDKLTWVCKLKSSTISHRSEGHEESAKYDISSSAPLHTITYLESAGYKNILFSPDSSRLAARSNVSDKELAMVVLTAVRKSSSRYCASRASCAWRSLPRVIASRRDPWMAARASRTSRAATRSLN